MSLRERAILFFAMAAVVGALFDAVVLTPLNARAKLRAAEVTTRRTEIDGLREKLLSASQQPADAPAVRLLAELREAEKRAAELAQGLRAPRPAVWPSWTMPPPCPPCCNACWWASPDAAQPPDPAHARQQRRWRPGAHPGLQWRGVDLQIEGGFVEITRYLQRLELELAGLRWGDMRLVSTSGQAQGATQLAPGRAALRIEAGPMTFTPVAPPGCCWCLPPPARAPSTATRRSGPPACCRPQQPRRPRCDPEAPPAARC